MSGSGRPRRDTRKPAYLQDYVCGDECEKKHNADNIKVDDTMQVLEHRAKSIKDKLTRNAVKAVCLLENRGSRSLLKAIGKRIETTLNDLESICQELSMMGDVNSKIRMQEWWDECQEYAEDVLDNITQDLDIRQGEPASEFTGSLHTDKLSGIDIWKWIKSTEEPNTHPKYIDEKPGGLVVGDDQPPTEIKAAGNVVQGDRLSTATNPDDKKAAVNVVQGDRPPAATNTDDNEATGYAIHGDQHPAAIDIDKSKVAGDAVHHDRAPAPTNADKKLDIDKKPSDVIKKDQLSMKTDLDRNRADAYVEKRFKGAVTMPPVCKEEPSHITYCQPRETEETKNWSPSYPTKTTTYFKLRPPPTSPPSCARDNPINSPVPSLHNVESGMPLYTKNVQSSPCMVPSREEAKHVQQFFQGMAKPKLRQFSGSGDTYFDWKEQFDLFICQSQIPVRHKMVMLKSALTGKPQQLIEHFGHTQEQFEAALFKLEQRYGGKRRLIQRHVKKIMSQSRVQEDDLKGLEKLADNVEEAVMGLLQHGGESALFGDSAILAVVMQKTPESVFLKYQESNPSHENLQTFSIWLSSYVSRRLELKEIRDSSHSDGQKRGNLVSGQNKWKNGKSQQWQQSSTSFASSSKSSKSKTSPEKKCAICGRAHVVVDCPRWKEGDVHNRWELAKNYKLCYRCLDSSHRAKFCEVNRKCLINGCQRNHHRDLHYMKKEESKNTQSASSSFGVSKSGKVNVTKVALKILPVRVYRPTGGSVIVNAFLDDGSDSSFIRQEIVEDLGLVVENTRLTLSTLIDTQEIDSGLVSFDVESLDGHTRRKIGARTMVNMCRGMYIPNWCKKKSKWRHLVDIPFPASPGRMTVDLVIGADHPELTLALEERIGDPGEPIARRTPLGWTCSGVVEQGKPRTELRSSHTKIVDETSLDEKFKALWNIDVMELHSDEILTPMEQYALNLAAQTRVKTNDRYQIGIPWKEGCPVLPDNRPMAERRLRSLEAQMAKNTDVAEKYREAFQANIDKGYIRKLKQSAAMKHGWYLPHFAVIKEDKETSKVRIVYDAAATYAGTSINEQMLPGPNLQKDILDILIRFRQKPVALGGDIKEMFNQVILDPKDKKYHRVLWRDLDCSKPIDVYEAERLIFGDRASPFLAQYVLQQQAQEARSIHPEAADVILTCTYMDDILDSIETISEARNVRKAIQEVAKSAGFDVKKWCSNKVELLEDVAIEDRVTGVIIGDAELPHVKTLGVWWDANEDTFTFTINWANEEVVSKRQLLSKIATTFDPLQFLTPLIIRGRVALQQAWLAGVDWDDKLPLEVQKSVDKWVDEMGKVKNLKIARCYRSRPIEDVVETEIHTFCDASKEAYAAVTFIRFTYRDGSASVSFVAAKSRVTPLRAVSIPRLELMAAVLGVRLSRIVAKVLAISITQHTFWTDSTDVIFWVRNQSRRFKPFVANRVSQIHESSSPRQWKHVPGKLNPADDATRGLDVSQISEHSRWSNGPEFLQLPREQWPTLEVLHVTPSEEADVETPSRKGDSVVSWCAGTTASQNGVIEFEKYSTWLKLVRVWSWVLRLCRRKVRCTTLSVEDLRFAEIKILHQLQRECFPEIFQQLSSHEKKSHKNDLRDLQPFIDNDGLLRVGGRLEKSELPYDSKFPIILPKMHHVATLIIRHYHEVGAHVRGVNGVLADTRSRFWIIRGREMIKSYERKCVKCQQEKKKIGNQLMAPLPTQRVSSVRAFSSCGVDYGGPYVVKITRNTSDKRYLCLFTCNASRAVHLEVAYSLDTAGFLHAFSRMVARRGKPEEMVSDNGTNFVGAERELTTLLGAMDQTRIANQMSNLGIKWKFNPPLASHHGGVFESLIKSAKRALRSILSENKLRDEELLTAVVEVEGLLNSRPLSYCSSDVKDAPVLTPNHFIYGQAGGQLAPLVVDEVAFNPRNRWRYVQDLVKQAWQRWQREYLHSLQQRPKWWKQSVNLKKGDVVMMVDQQNPRGRWPLARVIEAYPGEDGLVRSVRVLSQGKEYLRPISKLCPLEL